MAATDNLYIIMPAYNEEANIEAAVNEWYPIITKLGNNSRLVIIDDGSKDNTFSILSKLQETHPLLVPLTKPNSGHGATLLYGYNYCIENNATYIFQTDSDGQTNPNEFMQFWNHRDEYDIVIGKRVVRGDGKARKFVENVVCFLLFLFFNVKVEDANAPFRLMKSEIVKKYINKIPKNYNLPNIIFTAYFVRFNERVKFIEITFKSRQAGVNSINIKRIFKIGLNALYDFYNFRKDMNNER